MMEAGFGMRLIIFILVLLMALSGCTAEDKPFILPVNYSANALMKVYTDKTENDYKINIICRDGNYSIRTETENEAWNCAYVSGNRCIPVSYTHLDVYKRQIFNILALEIFSTKHRSRRPSFTFAFGAHL